MSLVYTVLILILSHGKQLRNMFSEFWRKPSACLLFSPAHQCLKILLSGGTLVD